MVQREQKFVTVDQLPSDPLAMPPPYWRGSPSVFQLLLALEELIALLPQLKKLHDRTEKKLGRHYEQYCERDDSDEAAGAFADICEPLWQLEHRIKMKADIASLMCAISAEDQINMACVFNLHRDIAESIEPLPFTEKMVTYSAMMGRPGARGDAVFEGVRKLSAWRNAYAHGHCVDRPTKSLRHNHLISPDDYPGVPDTIGAAVAHVEAYCKVAEYVGAISKNKYLSGPSWEAHEASRLVGKVLLYEFAHEGSTVVYDIVRRKKQASSRGGSGKGP
jgi:hypothetical protein